MNEQQTWCNPVRARLEAGQPAFGLTITTPSVEAAAHAATLGFHFLWIEMEHSPITLETLRLMVLAASACRYPPAGKRGSGAGAAVRTWQQPGNYYDSADCEIMNICMIEEASA